MSARYLYPLRSSIHANLLLKSTITIGHEAVIVKNGLRLCGTGGARASTAIQQNKAYWEVKLQQSGVWEVFITH